MMSPVRRNALLLALGLVFQSGMIQLAVALGTVTIVAVTGVEGILGLGPAVFLLAGAAAVGPAGRISCPDRPRPTSSSCSTSSRRTGTAASIAGSRLAPGALSP